MSKIGQEEGRLFYERVLELAISGGLGFWVATIVISLTPTAANYRDAESIPNIQTVWTGGLVTGMIIAVFVSYFLLRFPDRLPVRNLILKSVLLALIALLFVLAVVEVPSSLRTNDALRYFGIGVLLNLPRFLALGVAIGYPYSRPSARPLHR